MGISRRVEGTQAKPLVVTLALDEASRERFEAERRRYFPAARNQVPAHVSLFHALPGEQEAEVRATLAEACGAWTPFVVAVEDVQLYGGGVGYRLRSEELQALHAQLRGAWLPWLTGQDRQGFRPHVMVQNKAGHAAARELLARLAAQFREWEAAAMGIELWVYEGGPWRACGEFRFGARDGAR